MESWLAIVLPRLEYMKTEPSFLRTNNATGSRIEIPSNTFRLKERPMDNHDQRWTRRDSVELDLRLRTQVVPATLNYLSTKR